MSATVVFCVGGQQYSTIRETILKEPASRLGLLIRGVLPAVKDEAGTYFVDRDPRFFQLILNFLRDGWAMLPRSPDDRRVRKTQRTALRSVSCAAAYTRYVL